MGVDRVVKILDHFLFPKGMLEENLRLWKWVGEGGESDHFPKW